jgi:hypothetical protein
LSDGRPARAFRLQPDIAFLDLPDGSLAAYERRSGATHLCDGLSALLIESIDGPMSETTLEARLAELAPSAPASAVRQAIHGLLDCGLLQIER